MIRLFEVAKSEVGFRYFVAKERGLNFYFKGEKLHSFPNAECWMGEFIEFISVDIHLDNLRVSMMSHELDTKIHIHILEHENISIIINTNENWFGKIHQIMGSLLFCGCLNIKKTFGDIR